MYGKTVKIRRCPATVSARAMPESGVAVHTRVPLGREVWEGGVGGASQETGPSR